MKNSQTCVQLLTWVVYCSWWLGPGSKNQTNPASWTQSHLVWSYAWNSCVLIVPAVLWVAAAHQSVPQTDDGSQITGNSLFYDAAWKLHRLCCGWKTLNCRNPGGVPFIYFYLDDLFPAEGLSRVNYFCQSCDKTVKVLPAIRWRAIVLHK